MPKAKTTIKKKVTPKKKPTLQEEIKLLKKAIDVQREYLNEGLATLVNLTDMVRELKDYKKSQVSFGTPPSHDPLNNSDPAVVNILREELRKALDA